MAQVLYFFTLSRSTGDVVVSYFPSKFLEPVLFWVELEANVMTGGGGGVERI